MSPQLVIISAAMSLGGMATVGLNHYKEVEDKVTNHSAEVEEEVKKAEVAEVGARVETSIAEMSEAIRQEMAAERARDAARLNALQTEVELMKGRVSSHTVLMEHLAKEQTSLGFKVETHSKSFRPLRVLESRFTRVNSEEEGGELHPLLPPVDGSWKSEY